jgi:hypothetical protein
MTRPDPATDILDVEGQAGGWDETVTDNNDTLKASLFTGPYPLTLVHWDAPNENSVALSTFSAANYKWCILFQVDVNNVSTNGRIIYSDGTSWRYQKSNNVVTIAT